MQFIPLQPQAINRPAKRPANAFGGVIAPRFAAGLSLSDTVRFAGNSNFDRYRNRVQQSFKNQLTNFQIKDEIELVRDGKYVKVPRDYLDSPDFRRGGNEGGVGQGQGQPGDQVGQTGQDGQPQPAQPGDQPSEPGDQPGEGDDAGEGSGDRLQDGLDVVSLLDIYEALSQKYDFELPFEERGKNTIQKIHYKTNRISRVGPPGRLHPKRTFENALRREMTVKGSEFVPGDLQVLGPDFRYKDFKEYTTPKENAVIFYVMDTSGSQGKHEKDMARKINAWLSIVIQGKYGKINAELRDEKPDPNDFGNGVEEVHIMHEDKAYEVTQKEFYTISHGGGTKISSAYQMILDKLKDGTYPPDKYNIYIFQYTDGQNVGRDNDVAIPMLKELKELGVNRLGYVETYGSGRGRSNRGNFYDALEQAFGKDDDFLRKTSIADPTPEEMERVLLDLIGKKPDAAPQPGMNRFA